jgi:hypothetical protein
LSGERTLGGKTAAHLDLAALDGGAHRVGEAAVEWSRAGGPRAELGNQAVRHGGQDQANLV